MTLALLIVADYALDALHKCKARCELVQMHWSKLSIVLPSKDALCSHENFRETGTDGAVSHLWG